MTDPIERYYEEFETRYQAVARPAERPVRMWSVRRVAFAAAAFALVAGLALAVLPGTGRNGATAYAVQRASAVLATDGAIIHTVSTTTQYVEGEKVRLRSESWVGLDSVRTRFDEDGDGVEDQFAQHWDVGRQGADGKVPVRAESYNPATKTFTYYRTRSRVGAFLNADPVSGIRAKLADGGVTDEGVVTIRGRQARKLVARTDPTPPIQTGPNSGIASTEGSVTEYYVDAKTFEPIRIRSSYGDPADGLWTVDEIDRFERLPVNAETRQLLSIKVPAGTKRVDETAEWGALLSRR